MASGWASISTDVALVFAREHRHVRQGARLVLEGEEAALSTWASCSGRSPGPARRSRPYSRGTTGTWQAASWRSRRGPRARRLPGQVLRVLAVVVISRTPSSSRGACNASRPCDGRAPGWRSAVRPASSCTTGPRISTDRMPRLLRSLRTFLAQRGVDDRVEHGRGDEVLLVLVEVGRDLLGALDLERRTTRTAPSLNWAAAESTTLWAESPSESETT